MELTKQVVLPKTKAEAGNAGYFTELELNRGKFKGPEEQRRPPLAPHADEQPIVVKGEPRWQVTQYEPLVSITAAKKMGIRIPKQLPEPVISRSWNPGRRTEYFLYRLSSLQA